MCVYIKIEPILLYFIKLRKKTCVSNTIVFKNPNYFNGKKSGQNARALDSQ